MQPARSPNIHKPPRTISQNRHMQVHVGTPPPDLLPFVSASADDNSEPPVSYHAGGGFASHTDYNQLPRHNMQQRGAFSSGNAADSGSKEMTYVNKNAYNNDFAENPQENLDANLKQTFPRFDPRQQGVITEQDNQLNNNVSGPTPTEYAARQQQSFARPNRSAMVEQAGGPGFIFNAASAVTQTADVRGGLAGGRDRPNAFMNDAAQSSFHHVEDLDRFFVRVYRYHQRGGFWCMTLQELFEIVQFLFVIFFSVFLLRCVNYPVLFRDKPPPTWWYYPYINNNTTSGRPEPIVPASNQSTTDKLRLSDALFPASECLSHMPFLLILILIFAMIYLVFRCVRFCSHVVEYGQMQLFYRHALNIASDTDLQDYTWYEILQKMLHAQRHHQMSVHKAELTELDVYQRILRVENYIVALLNKAVVPVEIRVPLFLSTMELSLMYMPRLYELNLELLLFRGYAAPFENRCSLREEYKKYDERDRLIKRMEDRIMWLTAGNFLLSPVLFIWQCLYVIFNYGELLKRDPGVLGARTWSSYGKWYVRHFNELDHELRARLSRAYAPTNEYMSIFVSPLVTTIANNLVFFAGSVLVVLVALTVWDEDVITVEHVITLITGLGIIVAIGRAMLPDENLIWNPQQLMTSILAQIHYMPDGWTEQPHKIAVRDQVANLFQFKLVFLLQELWSPFLTPFMLHFALRKRAAAIVDFLRDYTDDVVGVGDVCAFALMDVRRHGKREWMPSVVEDAEGDIASAAEPREPMRHKQSARELEREIYAGNVSQPEGVTPAGAEEGEFLAESDAGKSNFGKTELSLIHFKLLNPKWRPVSKHNKRYLELVLQKCLQSPGVGHDQAPALKLSAFAQDTPLTVNNSTYYHPLVQSAYGHQASSDVFLRGEQLMRESLYGGGGTSLSMHRGGGVGSTSEHSTSSSGMSEASSSAAVNNNTRRNLAYASASEPMMHSLNASGTGGIIGGGLPLDLTAHAMSSSILQVYGAHLRRTQSNQHHVHTDVVGGRTREQSTGFVRSFENSPSAGTRMSPNEMTKARLSVIPHAVDDFQHQKNSSGVALDFSTTANAGSVHQWAASLRRWFPMRLIAGPSHGAVSTAGRFSERAPLVDSAHQRGGRRWLAGVGGTADEDIVA